MYTPNLGSSVTLCDRERKQGRFRRSSEVARGSRGGEHERAPREHGEARREQIDETGFSAGAKGLLDF